MEQRISRGRFHTGRRDLLTRRPGKGKGKRDPLVNGCDVQLQYSSWEIPAGREEEGECRRSFFFFFCDEGLCLSGCHSAPASQQRGPLPSASIVYFISHATPWQIPPQTQSTGTHALVLSRRLGHYQHRTNPEGAILLRVLRIRNAAFMFMSACAEQNLWMDTLTTLCFRAYYVSPRAKSLCTIRDS